MNHDASEFYLEHLNEARTVSFSFGTDSMGRDIFSLIWYGGRASIIIGLLSAAIITVIGIVYGCISGVSGSFFGFCDDADNRSSRKYTIYFIDFINYRLF